MSVGSDRPLLPSKGNTASWVQALQKDALPTPVVEQLKRTLLDALGAAIAGTTTRAGQIAGAFARLQSATGSATVLATGDSLTLPHAVLANCTAANAWDIDDGYRPSKGHPGGFVVMPALAAAQVHGAERLLPACAAGYEIACRAAIATHRYYHHYHASGSWGPLGTAAACASVASMPAAVLTHAFGLAEYHAALAPIERCLGAPAMTKDGIGWGAFAGACAVELAAMGFTGNPSLLDAPENSDLIEDLGERWRVLDLYFKPYPCCRWAQQGVEALLQLQAAHGFAADDVSRIVLHTFREATLLQQAPPHTTEEAQYHLFWAMAAALVHGTVACTHVANGALEDERLLRTIARMEAVVEPDLQAQFPERALAWVEVVCHDGARHQSDVVAARGDAHIPLSNNELNAKFFQLTEPLLGPLTEAACAAVWALESTWGAQTVVDLLPRIGRAIATSQMTANVEHPRAAEGGG